MSCYIAHQYYGFRQLIISGALSTNLTHEVQFTHQEHWLYVKMDDMIAPQK